MIKKLKTYMFSDTPLKTKVFYIVTLGALMACLIGILSALSNGLPYIGSLFAAVFLGCLILYVWKTRKAELGSYLLILFINCFLFPYCFYMEGGINGGVSMWYILSFFAVFLLMRGKWLWIMLLFSFASMTATYTIAYRHPDWVTPLKNEWTMYVDFVFSIVIIGSICGIIVWFQNQVYLGEQKKILDQNKELERLAKMKNSFFANMSHEIRTPINTIIGLNEMILREDVSDEVAENAVHIQSASKMLLTLINDILDMSKIESGKMEIVPIQYETSALFTDLVNIIWVRAHEKNLEFNLDISPGIPSILYGDMVRIKQVVTNLLTNAVKYTPKGFITLTARTEAIDSNRVMLTISVRDSGIGIKKEDIQHLFQSFQRVDETVTVGIEGTGLGLSITQQLVELMGGKITVDSIYQKGSIFTIQLEQKIINPKPIGHRNFLTKTSAGKRRKYKQIFEAPDARVLVVDDNEMNLLVAKKLLRETKIHVDLAKSGQECLELTRQHFYHVIFMDHMMPEMDGVEALHRLIVQENGLCHGTPVVALTANASSDADRIYKEKGFWGYLSKPVSGSLLEATLLKFLPKELVEYNATEKNEETENLVQTITSAMRKKVHITTDCVCDLPKEILEHYGIGMMHYYVYTDQGRFRDMEEMTSDNMLEYLMTVEGKVRTEPATVEEYESFFSDALEIGEHVIHISMAQNISTGFRYASAAAQSFDNVTVIDSQHLSNGLGLLVMCAAHLAEKGLSAEEILIRLDDLKNQITTSFIMPSPEVLHRYGKFSNKLYHICRMFGLHPSMTLKKGRLTLNGVYTGNMKYSYTEFIRRSLRGKKNIDTKLLFITYSGCSAQQLKIFQEEAEKCLKFDRVILQKTSATISSNCGLGTMGVSFIKNKKDVSPYRF